MKHVGEAVKNRGTVGNVARSKINVIGIAPWGVIDSSSTLVSRVSNDILRLNNCKNVSSSTVSAINKLLKKNHLLYTAYRVFQNNSIVSKEILPKYFASTAAEYHMEVK